MKRFILLALFVTLSQITYSLNTFESRSTLIQDNVFEKSITSGYSSKNNTPKESNKFWVGIKGGLISEYQYPNIQNIFFALTIRKDFSLLKNLDFRPSVNIGFYKTHFESEHVGNDWTELSRYSNYSNKVITGSLLLPIAYKIKNISVGVGIRADYNLVQDYSYLVHQNIYDQTEIVIDDHTMDYEIFSGLGLNKHIFQFNASIGYLIQNRFEIEAQYNLGANRTNYTLGLNYMFGKIKQL